MRPSAGRWRTGWAGQNGINVRMITQGPQELNIIFGVDNKDFDNAIRVLYNSFVKSN